MSIEWQWDQLRLMKVGGNESATKFFQQNGGTAALNSKDPKTKYQSNAATKYKDELKRRAARDANEFPGDVVVDGVEGEGSATPAGEPDDDFFASWDKPAIKKPTPPVSRTATPPVVGRTPSPFLNAAGADAARASSPLSKSDSAAEAKPAASRITTSAALRKTTTTTAKKTSVLGAKKVQSKLGVKKATGDVIDFDEAEKKAKEEADRIARLGYDPDAEEEAAKAKTTSSSSVVSPTPAKSSQASSSSSAHTHTRQKSSAEIERLGLGMGRLGFGQVGGKKPAGGAPASGTRNVGGFGSVGPVKAAAEDESQTFARSKFGGQKAISSDEYFGKGAYDSNAQAEAKTRLQGFEGATAISSNAYFGRPEDEETEDYGDLESTAKDFIRKFGITASDDLENLTSALGEGASRLQSAIRSYLDS
ncbi:ADP-ribosylation factor GTPase-activating protein glo3 [Escovopsis weberi]|uniref:ADP-ribosylation factor GTPase-activating protein glo3 n=1 Tax=Escovopsis weberi TaxID=150374 RepID=A0A0M8MSW8_ESCWE|nr:ADP-ribosylation factor GTPase-activating protein glo3 [Escovopsis weberi]